MGSPRYRHFEDLEPRRLFSCYSYGPGFTQVPDAPTLLADGTLRIIGTSDSDTIVMTAFGELEKVYSAGDSNEFLADDGTWQPGPLTSGERLRIRYALGCAPARQYFVHLERIERVVVEAGDGNDWVNFVGLRNLQNPAPPRNVPPVTIDGGDGSDQLLAGTHPATIFGGSGNDRITSSYASIWADGGSGSDAIYGNSKSDTLIGGSNDDVIRGRSSNDRISAGSGRDLVYAGAGNDIVDGGDDADTLYGDDGNDRLNGGPGVDSLRGGEGNDRFSDWGDVGSHDRMFGGPGSDRVLAADEGDLYVP